MRSDDSTEASARTAGPKDDFLTGKPLHQKLLLALALPVPLCSVPVAFIYSEPGAYGFGPTLAYFFAGTYLLYAIAAVMIVRRRHALENA